MKLHFIWTDEDRYRRIWDEMVADRRTKSMRALGGPGLPASTRLSPRYELLVRRSTREYPAADALRELRASLAHLADWAREAVMEPYRGTDTGECLLIAKRFIEWIVDDGQSELVGTVFVRSGDMILITLADSFPLGPHYAVDRVLLDTERRHMANL